MKRLLAVSLMVWASWAQSQPLSPFISGSLQQIVDAQRGKPFVLIFWSLDCTHCQYDLQQWGKRSQGKPAPALVLVAVDGPEQQTAIRARLQQYRLTSQPAWVFADTPEKLRFEIDRRWYGELPRTYFYRADGQYQAVSGKLSTQQIESWLREMKG